MGGNFGDSAAKEPGSILIEDSGVNNVRAHRGTTGTLDDAGEAPGGSSSGNFLQTEQVNHLKDAIIKEDTMAPKSETVPGIAPSTSETPDDVKPVTQNKVNLKHPIGEAAGESGPKPKRQKTDHDNASINAANSNPNLDEENGASPPVQQRALEQNSEPEGVAIQSPSQILNQGNGQSPSVQKSMKNQMGKIIFRPIANHTRLMMATPTHD
ncbi:uncharacterized protein LOC135203631 isoform X1 [Macrobrachium nipponense]|uniref:uncharacterized protein LOC135203631 isoform X1 n=1 Tax=Macrobrachium nipponense TaxID=159736 RepID=UPI0030C7D48C